MLYTNFRASECHILQVNLLVPSCLRAEEAATAARATKTRDDLVAAGVDLTLIPSSELAKGNKSWSFAVHAISLAFNSLQAHQQHFCWVASSLGVGPSISAEKYWISAVKSVRGPQIEELLKRIQCKRILANSTRVDLLHAHFLNVALTQLIGPHVTRLA